MWEIVRLPHSELERLQGDLRQQSRVELDPERVPEHVWLYGGPTLDPSFAFPASRDCPCPTLSSPAHWAWRDTKHTPSVSVLTRAAYGALAYPSLRSGGAQVPVACSRSNGTSVHVHTLNY